MYLCICILSIPLAIVLDFFILRELKKYQYMRYFLYCIQDDPFSVFVDYVVVINSLNGLFCLQKLYEYCYN